MEELADERLADPHGKLTVSLRIVLLAEQLGEAGNQHCLMVIKRRTRQGNRLGIEALVVANALREDAIFRLGLQKLKLSPGGRILLSDQPPIAIIAI